MFAQEIKFSADQSGTPAKFLEYSRGGWESEMRGNRQGEGEAYRNAWLPVHTEAVCV